MLFICKHIMFKLIYPYFVAVLSYEMTDLNISGMLYQLFIYTISPYVVF